MSQGVRWILLSLCLGLATLPAVAADTDDSETTVETVTVTGSLIPRRTDVETAQPITVITSGDMQVRGFTSIADALKQTSFSNGAVQDAQVQLGFTPGAKTLSLFGLSPSYVKYLIDGRPMIDYPALYNGTDTITSISGIPMELVDHIDILPGGQSSIYGSDAIAGVVNIIMKKKVDEPTLNLSYQGFDDGGGRDRRLTAAGGFSIGPVNFTAGAEYGRIDPIWGYQRSLTSQYFTDGTSPQTAERDYVVIGNGFLQPVQYFFTDPNNCANTTGQVRGSVRRQSRPGRGDYCGTTQQGFYTLSNKAKQLNGYVHGTMDVSDALTLYTDVLASDEKVGFTSGTAGIKYYSTDIDYITVYEPDLQEFVTLQHLFSPEEIGGLSDHLDYANTKAYSITLGGNGKLGGSGWAYDVAFTGARQKLTEKQNLLLTDELESFFSGILGPDLGPDPIFGAYSTFRPDYEAFFTPITPEDFDSFDTVTANRSKTTDSMLRAQLTQSSLFTLPGGDAGLAVVMEYGRQKWNYDPDPLFLSGQTYASTATAGGGKRSRYALTSELRMPVWDAVSFTASGRYDAYRVSGGTIDKTTYMLGVEVRPLKSLMLRGRYGTAFKAPTLSDEFQGESGFYQLIPDYYRCLQDGIDFAHAAADCLYYDNYFGTTEGNPALKPINAKVWDIGLVYAPLRQLSMTVDVLSWDIDDEVTQQDSDKLLRDEALCRTGGLDPSSPNCTAALSQVTRDTSGTLLSFLTPKVNVSNEKLTALTLGLNYTQDIGRFGQLAFQGSWNNMLKHHFKQYDTTPTINLLTNPYWSTEFRNSGNASVTWNIARASTTLYANYRDKSPNYLATLTPDGYLTDGAGKLKSWTLVNLNFGYQLTDHIQLSGTIDNLFNKMPPLDRSYSGLDYQPYNYLNYNVYGRSYIMEMAYKFGK